MDHVRTLLPSSESLRSLSAEPLRSPNSSGERQTRPETHEATSTGLPIAWVERIFAEFEAIFSPGKLAAAWGDATDMRAVKERWARELHGLTREELATGLRRCARESVRVRPDGATESWPPTLPEFRQFCEPPRPDYRSLFSAAVRGDFRNPLAYWALQRFGPHDARVRSWESARGDWIECVDAILETGEIPAVPPRDAKALPPPRPSREEGRARLAHIREIIAGRATA